MTADQHQMAHNALNVGSGIVGFIAAAFVWLTHAAEVMTIWAGCVAAILSAAWQLRIWWPMLKKRLRRG